MNRLPPAHLEIEVKLPIADREDGLRRLHHLGARLVQDFQFEDNALFDLTGGVFAREGKLLRVRRVAERAWITIKAPEVTANSGVHKVRREWESEIIDPRAMMEGLRGLGFELLWRYQKRRSLWEFEDVEIMLDEVPFGWFLEVEGAAEAIDRTAVALGFTPADYVIESYRALHEADCLRRGVPVGHLTFAEPE